MLPSLTGASARELAIALRRAGYHTDGVRALLGDAAHAALSRDEPASAVRAAAGGGELGVLVALFLLGEARPEPAVAAAIAPLDVSDALAAGLLRAEGQRLCAALDVRPHADDHGEWWVVSDVEPARSDVAPGPEHVVGIGQASISLIRATVRHDVDTLLDLGTGCGVQALHAARWAGRITATDVSDRAMAMARATFALNDIDVELLRGPWFEPVAGRRFDQVVSNPPFVVGPPRVELVYRDSGLAGDAGSERLVREIPGHLTEGGVGQLLAAWLHPRDGDWRHRVASWLPARGVHAWVIQRDVADPALYIATWLSDSGIDPRSARGRAGTDAWLDWFSTQDADGIGFGFITVRHKPDQPSIVVCEDVRQPMSDPLGPEIAGWLDRTAWLAGRDGDDILDTVFVVSPDVRLDRTSTPGPDGWVAGDPVLRRTSGPGWAVRGDDWVAALLGGCTGALPVGELLGLLALAEGEPVDRLRAAALPVVVDLVRRGMLDPAGGYGAAR